MEKRTYGKIVLEKNKICVFSNELFINSMLGINFDFCDLMRSVAKRYETSKE